MTLTQIIVCFFNTASTDWFYLFHSPMARRVAFLFKMFYIEKIYNFSIFLPKN